MNPVGAELLSWLVDRHGAALQLYARQWCRGPEDVVQEALMQLVRQPATPERVVAWLFRVVRNRAISASRAERARARHEALAATDETAWFQLPASEIVEVGAATAALHELPLEQREVVIAHFWGELTFEEIGRLTGTSASTAHRRYEAALESLRERLGIPWPNKTPLNA